jgi:hypothetical protein
MNAERAISPDVRFAEHGYICERCGRLCDTVEVSELDSHEPYGGGAVVEQRYLVSACCEEGVEPTRDGAFGEVA